MPAGLGAVQPPKAIPRPTQLHVVDAVALTGARARRASLLGPNAEGYVQEGVWGGVWKPLKAITRRAPRSPTMGVTHDNGHQIRGASR
jgi:hypothetical protein